MSAQAATAAPGRTASQMMLVPLYCVVSAEQMPDVFAASTTDESGAVVEDAQSSVSSWDDDLCSFLWTAYNYPKDWTRVEQGLHLRVKALPCFESAFVEEEAGEYRRWGISANDWQVVATYLKISLIIVYAAMWSVSFADPDGERGGEAVIEIKVCWEDPPPSANPLFDLSCVAPSAGRAANLAELSESPRHPFD